MPDETKEPVFSELDVIGRCKQCHTPVTSSSRVTGPTGLFCSAECKEKHEAFLRRAHELESHKRVPLSLAFRIRKLASTVVSLVVLLVILGLIAILFDIPVAAPVVRRVLGMFGL